MAKHYKYQAIRYDWRQLAPEPHGTPMANRGKIFPPALSYCHAFYKLQIWRTLYFARNRSIFNWLRATRFNRLFIELGAARQSDCDALCEFSDFRLSLLF